MTHIAYKSARTGRAVRVPAFADAKPTREQRIIRPGVCKQRLVKVQSAGRQAVEATHG